MSVDIVETRIEVIIIIEHLDLYKYVLSVKLN